MSNAINIIHSFTRIQERADIFKHHREEIFAGLNLAEVHCIAKIGSMEYANVTKVAHAMHMTRGAISKISKKLLNKQLVESYQKPENNKEVYFCLTTSGKLIYDEHKVCHEQAKLRKLKLLSNYSEAEQIVILRFLEDINQQQEQGLREEA
ncbi:DNA-binding transcriptional regulator, MarR family [Propionispira arboris]|uniref:DNA-binding transcriptional regulator, MarR family n=1 Tax=Propionispira arboris TaxID=84035 RepID=A0A1H6YVQ0_9FIRM|nr:MarR family transcriptional regulator [Propionispira arboris]SEJ45373.1 DNA-binding transcriptional regulator, MarR family [Propionispira arboris]